jgi:hypothetical protein
MAARTLKEDDSDPHPTRGSKLNSIVEVIMANVLIQRLLATGLLTISMQPVFAGDAMETLREVHCFGTQPRQAVRRSLQI